MSDDVNKDDAPEVPVETPSDLVNIVTIAIGTFGVGITLIGTQVPIKPEAFSENWMRPKTMGDRNKLVAAGKLPKPEAKKKVAD